MLVLSRRVNEQIVLGNGLIVVTVVDIRDDKVRIGIDAPIEMPVHRREVQDAIDRESDDQDGHRADESGDGTC